MRTPLLAALALLAPALAAPASAEPLWLDEGRLAGVAAGQVDAAAPGFSISSLNSSSTTNNSSNAVDTRIGQMLSGSSTNSNNALGLSSSGVTAQGTASATVMGTISGLGSP